jgi:histidinol phosphatase-like enzyme
VVPENKAKRLGYIWQTVRFRTAAVLKIDLAKSFIIGDRFIYDVDCGRNAGCKNAFADWGSQEILQQQPDYGRVNLLAAAKPIQTLILKSHARTRCPSD